MRDADDLPLTFTCRPDVLHDVLDHRAGVLDRVAVDHRHGILRGQLLDLVTSPLPLAEHEIFTRAAIAAATQVNDAKLQCFVRFAIGWEEFHLGRTLKALEAADELISVGQRLNDSRSIGYRAYLKAWIAVVNFDPATALRYADKSIELARAPFELEGAKLAKIIALVIARRGEALPLLRLAMAGYERDGWYWYLVPSNGFLGVALVLDGRFAEGLRQLERTIAWLDASAYTRAADWHRITLSEGSNFTFRPVF